MPWVYKDHYEAIVRLRCSITPLRDHDGATLPSCLLDPSMVNRAGKSCSPAIADDVFLDGRRANGAMNPHTVESLLIVEMAQASRCEVRFCCRGCYLVATRLRLDPPGFVC